MKPNLAFAISNGEPQFLEKSRHEYTIEDKKKANLDNVVGDPDPPPRNRQSGPRPEPRLLCQPALEALTNSARTDSPRKTRPERFPAKRRAAAGGARQRLAWTGPTGEHSVHPHHCDFIVTPIADQIGPIDSVSKTEHYDLKNRFSEPQCKMTVLPLNSGKPRTCVTLNGSGIQLAVGPQPLRLRNHNSGLAQRIMVKRLAKSRHDPLGITDSACKNQSVVVSVQYGPFNPYIPIRSTTIGKSRVAIDPIAMHTSWRSNSDIASVTSTCVTLNGSGIQLAMGPQPLWLRNHNSGPAQRIMVKRLATSPHDPLDITDSACKNQLVVVSAQYGPFNPYIPIRSTTIGKSRVAIDPIAMHTSWRSNSDITSVTSIGYPRMSASGESSTTIHRLLHASGSHRIPTPYDPKTNQYNQDLGLIHSTNGNHLESPNEGSSIDHQVTIYLHAQNVTMFPTNETWYFASQILVSNSGGLILILTAQSTRNMFRIHSDY
ncbi:protein EXPORTIN 1A [Dorcoceras hygrometricum]|uniref:Protein EXPORTIN 1A n=1 Tax=Dorcoceras hygrometricum TaxID=472368 RepID=A0A2Z7BIU0_9LAMI|nr:protein EXPORTIN 1A [Dorcoceras hygrometricum]